MIKPWLQIAAFVLFSNVAHVSLLMIGQGIDDNVFTFLSLAVSCWFCVALIVMPRVATTGHKLLTLTFAFGAIYCSVATIAATWSTKSVIAWGLFSLMSDNFYAVAKTLTALELISIFINNATRLGKIGGVVDGVINHVYSSVFDRAYALFSRKGV